MCFFHWEAHVRLGSVNPDCLGSRACPKAGTDQGTDGFQKCGKKGDRRKALFTLSVIATFGMKYRTTQSTPYYLLPKWDRMKIQWSKTYWKKFSFLKNRGFLKTHRNIFHKSPSSPFRGSLCPILQGCPIFQFGADLCFEHFSSALV